jgi:5-methylcytosine-specific restriction endonuclease McrBC regulatory subunit McrC
MDTKYKLLDLQDDHSPSGIVQNDIYQMLAYAIQRKSRQVHLIYPLTQEQPQESFVYTIENTFSGETIQIFVHQIPVIDFQRINYSSTSVADNLTPSLIRTFQSILHP